MATAAATMNVDNDYREAIKSIYILLEIGHYGMFYAIFCVVLGSSTALLAWREQRAATCFVAIHMGIMDIVLKSTLQQNKHYSQREWVWEEKVCSQFTVTVHLLLWNSQVCTWTVHHTIRWPPDRTHQLPLEYSASIHSFSTRCS